MKKRGQSATEFMLLITAVLFICIPAFYLLVDYSLKQSDDANRDQIMHTSQSIVDEAREMYYLGRFSKEVITVRMPDNINSMSTLSIGDDEHYLIVNFTYKRSQVDLAKPCEVPLLTGDCSEFSCLGTTCRKCSFRAVDYREGTKEFRIETVPYGSVTAVNITSLI